MRSLKLKVRYPKRFKTTTDSHHNEAISPNRLYRQFKVDQPNRVWTTDITYVWSLQGWLYVAVVFDLFSRQVVGWAIDDHMRTSLLYRWRSGGVNLRQVCSITWIAVANIPAENTVNIWRS